VPTGIATDATTAPFFAMLVESRRLARLVDFENRNAIFPSVHRSYKFCLLTLGRDEGSAHFAFFLTDPAQLAEPERNFTLSPEAIAAINPNTKTAPIFRSRFDADLTAKIHARVPVLIKEAKDERGNPWGAYYLRLVHFGDHSKELYDQERAIAEGFVREGQRWIKGETTLLPVWESKLTNMYCLHYATFVSGERTLELRDRSDSSKQIHRYWVTMDFFASLLEKYPPQAPWMLGYRDVARATDERSVIALALPREPASIKHPTLGWNIAHPGVALLANMNSLPFDFVARQKLGGISLSFFILKQLPILTPNFYTEPRLNFITPRVLELNYTSYVLAPFARDLAYDGPPFAWDDDRRARLRAELDAFYARAYGLSRDELRYILDPADVKGVDYPSETFRVLKEKEIRTFGEYRTRRLVLEAWSRMEADGTFAHLGLGRGQVAEIEVRDQPALQAQSDE
jgi:hypothetical protein